MLDAKEPGCAQRAGSLSFEAHMCASVNCRRQGFRCDSEEKGLKVTRKSDLEFRWCRENKNPQEANDVKVVFFLVVRAM